MASKKTASVLASVVAVSTLAGNAGIVNAKQQGEALLDMHKNAEITTSSALEVQPVEVVTEEVKAVSDVPSLKIEGDTKVWNFKSLDFQVLVQNEVAMIQEIEIDATASGAKFNAKGRDNAQVNAGTVIKVPVNGAALIEILHGYDKGPLTVKDPSGKLLGKIDGVSDKWQTDTISYTGSKSGFLTLEVPSGQFFIKTIKTVEVKQEEVGTLITVGPNGDYQKVQDALDAIVKKPTADNRVTIEIEPGVYEEEVTVLKPYITFKNADPSREVKITYDKAVDHDSDPAKVQGTQKTASVTISSGATGFEAYDITFENAYNLGQKNLGHEGRKQTQAVVLVSMADRVVFERCNFIGRQDTLYLKGASKGKDNPEVNERRVYLKDCYIEGTIDFVFGDATAVFENCELYMAYYSNGGYYTAPNTLLITQMAQV
nr:pectinesterase family protein [uncultured Cellulosilyticum sp.]